MKRPETDFEAVLGRALTNMTISTIKSCITVVEACETPQEAVREMTKWLKENQKLVETRDARK